MPRIGLALCLPLLFAVVMTACSGVHTGDGGETAEDITECTLQAVGELNEQSDLSGVKLLGERREGSHGEGPFQLTGSGDSYLVFSYDGRECVAQIVLASDAAHVYSVKVGVSMDEADTALEAEGYEKLSTPPPGEFMGIPSSYASYQKAHITIALYAEDPDTENPAVSQIVIEVTDPVKPSY